MKAWEERPNEIATLLNPAFCGEILRRCLKEYEVTSVASMPYPLVFLTLPIVLHPRTRSNISSRQRQPLHTWLQSHQDLKVGFAERARQLVPVTNEALTFLLQVGAVTIEVSSGGLSIGNYRAKGADGDGEVADCFAKAKIVGRWFAHAGTPTTVYAMWGVTV